MTSRQRPRRGRQERVTESLWSVRLGGGHERAHQRCLATQRDLDVGPTRQLQHGPGVDGHLDRVHIARDARDRPDVGVGGRAGVQQREAVVDARVTVDEQRQGARGGHQNTRLVGIDDVVRVIHDRDEAPPVECGAGMSDAEGDQVADRE